MPFRFRKTFTVIPGVLKVNLNKRSVSATVGGEHTPHVTFNSSGRRTTSVDLPGPLSWTSTSTPSSRARKHAAKHAELLARKNAALARRRARRESS